MSFTLIFFFFFAFWYGYQGFVRSSVTLQVVNCKDEIAQYYLMDCIIQVFPDEYHLQTLETLLGAFPQLQVDSTLLLRELVRLSKDFLS